MVWGCHMAQVVPFVGSLLQHCANIFFINLKSKISKKILLRRILHMFKCRSTENLQHCYLWLLCKIFVWGVFHEFLLLRKCFFFLENVCQRYIWQPWNIQTVFKALWNMWEFESDGRELVIWCDHISDKSSQGKKNHRASVSSEIVILHKNRPPWNPGLASGSQSVQNLFLLLPNLRFFNL